ncbi:membrane protein [Labilithrix luteola]|uniref:Membrane protein n=1 Tax=Labilithrix luteola TaxID=1391654 RepID=A0A0K1PVB8_9BACT|nr:Bax inhibitor-1/YccA family protein [Labilithrix luteola]AKU97311.1 membrane protein [Labilithrix luteola]
MYYASPRELERVRAHANDALWITYRWMTLGLATTGIVALLTASSPAMLNLIFGNRLVFWGLIIAQLGLVFSFTAAAARARTATVATMFFAYAALTGLTFASLFLIYTGASIASVFFITAGAFGGLSAVGLFTKRDLSAIGRFAIFALFGIIIASIVNIFVASAGFSFLVSIAGVLIFGALTAYDTQKLKNMYASGEVHANVPLVGALVLYLDFVNMFLFLLRLFGSRRE